MRVLFWIIRGFGSAARKGQIKDYIIKERIDIIGLQETIKQDFSDNELNDIGGNHSFHWSWLPAR